ncbi:MAG: DUF4855 domain-containing protein [Bacillota bacterium]|nr:DUF4855 domain-containing protein [Bacillota bacterium]MDD4263561.1 DUF4855 domain-containing protein [Bacillota bacterium]
MIDCTTLLKVMCIVFITAISLTSFAKMGDILFEDQFSEISSNWTFDRNNWVFRDGYLAHDVYTIGSAICSTGKDWTDYELTTRFRVTKFGNSMSSVIVFFRALETWNCFGLSISQSGLRLVRYDGAWNESQLLGEKHFSVKANVWYDLKIQVQANQVKVFLDDKLQISGFDPLNKFTHGSFAYYADYATAEIDSVKVTELDPKEVIVDQTTRETILDEDESDWPGYQKPVEDGPKHIMLFYTHRTWSPFDLLPYVAYGERTDETDRFSAEYKDWFYDTFLLLNIYGDNRTNPTNINHWNDWLERLFGSGKNLDNLNQAVDLARTAGVQGDDYKLKVILMIPYPSVEQHDFGDVDSDGVSEDFRYHSARLKAVEWFLDEALEQFDMKRYHNLELIGFYWFEEQITGSDGNLVKAVTKSVHDLGYGLYWIPMYTASGIENVPSYNIDGVMMQAGYFWGLNLQRERLKKTAAIARKNNLGVEIEFDGKVSDPVYRERLYEYLDVGFHQGYMTDALLGYYEGGGGLLQLFNSSDPEIYALYKALYEYCKGTYEPKVILENEGSK